MPRPASRAVRKAISRFLAATFLAVPILMFAVQSQAQSQAEQPPIRFGYIDPLSGAFAQQGDASLKMFAYVLDRINAKGGALGQIGRAHV